MKSLEKKLLVGSAKVQLTNLSPKAAEIRRTFILRQNALTPTHLHTKTFKDKVSPRVISGGAVINPKLPNQAMPRNTVAITPPGPYKTGDGDFPIALRPGANDHKQYKSLVTAGSTTYARGHV